MRVKDLYKREYSIWKAMRARCNSKCNANSTYQKKGIKVCSRWDSFYNFLNDMGRCPENHSMDRIDNNGDYSPENCRWATQTEQCQNRGTFNLVFTYQGKTQCLKQWARDLNIGYTTLYLRVKRNPSITAKELFTYQDPRTKKLLWQGSYYSRDELCSMYNIPKENFYDRWHKGWNLERILLTEIKHKI